MANVRLPGATAKVLHPRGPGVLPRPGRVIHVIVGIALLYAYCLLTIGSAWIPIGVTGLFAALLGLLLSYCRTASLQVAPSRLVYRGLPGVRSAIDRAEIARAAVRYFGGTVRGRPVGAFVLSAADGRVLLVLPLSVWLESDLLDLVDVLSLSTTLTRRESSVKAFDHEFPGRQGWMIRHPSAAGWIMVAGFGAVMIAAIFLTVYARGR